MSPGLGAPPLQRAEVYFADAARGMVEGGDWLVPRYEGRPFFDKPILSYWLMAAAMEAFGTTAAAARLVPLGASLLVLLATAWLGTLLFDRRSAAAGGIVLASTFAFLSFARVAMSDMLLVLWTTLAVALAVRAYRSPAAAWAVPALGAVLGLGFATKGPIAVLVPALALLLLGREMRRLPPGCGISRLALAAAGFVVLGLGWFALVYNRLGAEPLAYFFLRENLQRFAGETFDIGRPFWFYLPAYLAQGLPWSPFLALALWRILRDGDGDEPSSRAARFLATWVLLVLVPLSLSRGKLDYYLLPLYPPLSLLLGRYLAVTPWRRLDVHWARAVLLLGAAGAFLLALRPPRLPTAWLPEPFARVLLLATLVLGALALVLVAWRPSAGRVGLVLAASTAAVFAILVGWFLPAFSRAQPNEEIARDVARERVYQPRARLALCSDPTRARREVLFSVRHAPVEQCDLWSLAGSRDPFLLLVTPAQNESFRVLRRYRHVASYPYLPADTLTFDGLFGHPQAGEVVLFANYPTNDSQADLKRKREWRRQWRRIQALNAAEAGKRALEEAKEGPRPRPGP